MSTPEVNATPAAVELAAANQVDLEDVEGTGTDGRVTVDDVRSYVEDSGEDLVPVDQETIDSMFFIRPDDFLWINLNGNDFRWMQRDGAILRKVENPDLDAYKATLYKYSDLGVTRRGSQGVIYNLADDIP